MKSYPFMPNIKLLFLSTMVLFVICTSSACSEKIDFVSSSIVPTARGHVRIRKDSNKNYRIKVNLLDLTEVKQLRSTKQSYVIWMIGDHTISKNLGQIKSKRNVFSRGRKATFETVSTFRPNQIFITAEEDVRIQHLSSQVVISTPNF